MACSDPIAPTVTPSRADPSVIDLATLQDGQEVHIRFHSQGCFFSYDAHFVFVQSGHDLLLSGSLHANVIRGLSHSTLAPRTMTPTATHQLDEALGLYRRERNQRGCMSTQHYTADLYLGPLNEPQQHEHYAIDGCVELLPPPDKGPWLLQPRPNMLFLHDLAVPMLDSLLAHMENGTA
jgi:hypothetical protein